MYFVVLFEYFINVNNWWSYRDSSNKIKIKKKDLIIQLYSTDRRDKAEKKLKEIKLY